MQKPPALRTLAAPPSSRWGRFQAWLPFGVATVLVVGAGLLHGFWTGRWSNWEEELGAANTRMQRLPMKLGEWEGQATDVDPRAIEKSGVHGYLCRRYTNPRTGAEVSIFLVCGRPGPVSVHSPTVCYQGAGYDMSGPEVKIADPSRTSNPPAEFWEGKFFKSRAAVPTRLRILWAWTADGQWQAADNPRVAFASSPYLYKLYVVTSLPADDKAPTGESCEEFLRVLLPELQRTLFASTASGGR